MEIKNKNIKKAYEIVYKMLMDYKNDNRSLEMISIITAPLEDADKEMSEMIDFLKEYGTCKTCGNGHEPKENDFLCDNCECDEHGIGNINWYPNDALRAIKESDADDYHPDWDTIARDGDAAVKILDDADKHRQYQQKLLK